MTDNATPMPGTAGSLDTLRQWVELEIERVGTDASFAVRIGKLRAILNERAALLSALEAIKGFSEENGMTRRRMRKIAAEALAKVRP